MTRATHQGAILLWLLALASVATGSVYISAGLAIWAAMVWAAADRDNDEG